MTIEWLNSCLCVCDEYQNDEDTKRGHVRISDRYFEAHSETIKNDDTFYVQPLPQVSLHASTCTAMYLCA